MSSRLCFLGVFALLQARAVHAGALNVKADDSTGSYAIDVNDETWFPSAAPVSFTDGTLASLKLTGTKVLSGSDPLHGSFTEYRQDWLANGVTPVTHHVRHFVELDAIEFQTHFPLGMNNTSANDVNAVAAAFTAFKITGPAAGDPNERGYASWAGNMLADKYTKFGVWNEHADGIQGGINGSLLALFDSKAETSLVLSASSNFMAASVQHRVDSSTLYLGVMGGVTSIPADYEISFVLCASKQGPSAAFRKWGDFLLQKFGKDRSLRDSDYILNNLGYSTDNGAYYYYHSENDTSRWKSPENFEQTQIDIKAYADRQGIPYRYILLDSWWYPKDEHDAVTTWTALPSVYPHGLYNIWEKTGWRVQGHNRFWSAATPYAKQNGGAYDFIVEPDSHKSIPVDQVFWDDLFANTSKWGLTMYEQDWLHNEFEGLNCTLSSATLARQWLLQMGRGAAKNDVTIQYCMPYPRHILQSVEVPAVTNFRASDDYHPGNDQWKLGLSSILADSLALAPSKDNYWSTRKQPGNNYGLEEPNSELQSAVTTYTAGPVAPSDMIDGSDAKLIMRAANTDGLLLKPSRPAMSIDATFAFRAFGRDGPDGEVMVSYSDVGSLRFYHILAANVKNGPYNLKPSGLPGGSSWAGSRVFKHMPGNTAAPAELLPKAFSEAAPIALASCGTQDFHLIHTAPVLPGFDWVVLGELSKWVPMSPQRVESLSWTAESFSMLLRGAVSEKVEMWFAKADNKLVKVACTLSESGTATLTMPAGTCGAAAVVSGSVSLFV